MDINSKLDMNTIVLILSLLVSFGGFVVALMIKSTQADVKSELKQQLSETTQNIAVHIARDDERFANIDDKLSRIDGKLDKMNGRTTR